MTRVIVIGDGGREDALARTLETVATVTRLPSSTPRTEITWLVADSRDHLVLIGPEQPLVEGLADWLRAEGVRVLGPCAAGARLEGSKAFMKEVLAAADVPTANYQVITELEKVYGAIDAFGLPIVIKTDGLAAGKGVCVARNQNEAIVDAAHKLAGEAFGHAGRTLVVEQALEGPELSFIALCDGTLAVPLPTARDHKRLRDGDEGPNTGGMGAFAPVLGVEDIEGDLLAMVRAILRELVRRGIVYQGFMYLGVMLTPTGPKVLEVNVRLGDPEAQVVLPLVDPGQLLSRLIEAADGELQSATIDVYDKAAVTVTLAAEGYPDAPRKGDLITGIEEAEALEDVTVFRGGIMEADGSLETSGGRVAYVTATKPTFAQAREAAYAGVRKIWFAGMQFRHDIGKTK